MTPEEREAAFLQRLEDITSGRVKPTSKGRSFFATYRARLVEQREKRLALEAALVPIRDQLLGLVPLAEEVSPTKGKTLRQLVARLATLGQRAVRGNGTGGNFRHQ